MTMLVLILWWNLLQLGWSADVLGCGEKGMRVIVGRFAVANGKQIKDSGKWCIEHEWIDNSSNVSRQTPYGFLEDVEWQWCCLLQPFARLQAPSQTLFFRWVCPRNEWEFLIVHQYGPPQVAHHHRWCPSKVNTRVRVQFDDWVRAPLARGANWFMVFPETKLWLNILKVRRVGGLAGFMKDRCWSYILPDWGCWHFKTFACCWYQQKWWEKVWCLF